MTTVFAEYSNSKIGKIRSNINQGIGQKEHLKIDTTLISLAPYKFGVLF